MALACSGMLVKPANVIVFAEGEVAFEDGTINYLTLPAVEIGLRHLMSIGMETIHDRVMCLTSSRAVAVAAS